VTPILCVAPCHEIRRSYEYEKAGHNSQFGITITWISS